jgi:hypothetical protein
MRVQFSHIFYVPRDQVMNGNILVIAPTQSITECLEKRPTFPRFGVLAELGSHWFLLISLFHLSINAIQLSECFLYENNHSVQFILLSHQILSSVNFIFSFLLFQNSGCCHFELIFASQYCIYRFFKIFFK